LLPSQTSPKTRPRTPENILNEHQRRNPTSESPCPLPSPSDYRSLSTYAYEKQPQNTMPPVPAQHGGAMGPSVADKLKMGAMMGGTVGAVMGFVF
ncbi:hypothetical protein CTA2_2643, partial [Colletotrichum tanaceti]